MARLAALVPAPRVNLLRYHGAFAPNARIRKLIIPSPDNAMQPRQSSAKGKDNTQRCRHGYDWAELLRRVFEIDILNCPKCGSRMQRIALITQTSVIQKILRSVGQPTAPPDIAPACFPEEQYAFDW